MRSEPRDSAPFACEEANLGDSDRESDKKVAAIVFSADSAYGLGESLMLHVETFCDSWPD